MSNFNQSIHSVTKIELTTTFVDNGNSRTIRITDEDGGEFSFTFYGKTDALDALPRSADFAAYTQTAEAA